MNNISGNIHVTGDIETHVPPKIAQQREAAEVKKESRDFVRFVVECATVVLIAIYAGLTLWQGCLTRELVVLGQKTYDASQRPYIGLNTIEIDYVNSKDPDRTHSSKFPTDQSDGLAFTIKIKNFGPVPGTNYKARCKGFVDNIPMLGFGVPDTPTTVFPTQEASLMGGVWGEDYKRLLDGRSILDIEVTVDYDGPAGHYSQCDRNQFFAKTNVFADLGQCVH